MSRPMLLAGAFLSAFLASAAVAQTVDLRPRWEKGAEHRFRMESESRTGPAATQGPTRNPRPDDAHRQTVMQDFDFVLRVVDARPEADATVEFVFEHVKVSMEGPEGKSEFDSARPDAARGKPADAFRTLAGIKLTLTIAPDGSITSVRCDGPTVPDDALAAIGGREGISRLIRSITTLHKGGGVVRRGASWEHVDLIDSALIGRLRMTTRHTVRSVRAREAVVDVAGTIAGDSDAPDGLVAIRDGKVAGSYTWDAGAGMLRSLESRQSFRVQTGLGDDPLLPGDLAVEQRTTVTRLDRARS